MRLLTPVSLAVTIAFAVLAIACGSSGEGGREVRITQSDDGCTPESVEATTGEKLNLVVTNESGKEPYEVEGEGDTPLEEIIVPEGKTREVGLIVPNEPGTYEIKCYVPGDLETIIELRAAGSDGAVPTRTPLVAEAELNVVLEEFAIIPESDSIDAGVIAFNVENTGPDDVHEFVVVKTDLEPDALPTDDDGSVDEDGEALRVIGEIEDISVGETQTLIVDLEAGAYVLLCNIYDPTVDEAHYSEGMTTAFTGE